MDKFTECSAPWDSSMFADNYLQGKYLARTILAGDEILFIFAGNEAVKMHHEQQCCESVYLEDFNGDIEDLQDCVLIYFEERIIESKAGTATFYDIQTNRGNVTLVWRGESNGYYSETVNLTYGKIIPCYI